MSIKINTIVECKITGISSFGAFVDVGDSDKGMIHISEFSHAYLDDITSKYNVGDVVTAKVISISDDGKLSLSIKQVDQDSTKTNHVKEVIINADKKASTPEVYQLEKETNKDDSFEEMMRKFKRTSEDKMCDLNKGESRGYSRRRGRR